MMTLCAPLSTLLALKTHGVVGRSQKTAPQVIPPQHLTWGRSSYKLLYTNVLQGVFSILGS